MACMHANRISSAKAALAFLLLAAGATLGPAAAQQPKASPPAPVATVPGFTVAITYSQKAMATLTSSKETVIVDGDLYGFAKPGTPKQDADHMGEVYMGEVKDEIAPGATATFKNVQTKQANAKWIDSRGVQLLINVYSGRKSSPNNLLDCGIYEGPLKDVQGTTIPIACKLIGE
jgi:hypothetical protein